MKRLTTDNPQGNFETILNYVYSKDGIAYIRSDGASDDVPLHEWAKRECLARGCTEFPGTTFEEIDEAICECALDYSECPIFLAYTFACQAVHLRDKLKKYEDTGLNPEEITTKQPWCVFYCNRKCNLDGEWCAEGPGCQKEIDSETAKHLLELAKAEKDGRLVVLPCKIGDTLFDTTMGDIKELTVKSIPMMLYPHGLHIGLNATNYRGAFLLIEMWQIGKTIFSTREEAEAALKGLEEQKGAEPSE